VPRRIFLDANLIINYRFEKSHLHPHATALPERLLRAAEAGGAALYITPLVIDEVWWKLTELLHNDEFGDRAWGKLKPARRKTACERYSTELEGTGELLALTQSVRVEPVIPEDIPVALRHMTHAESPHLDPRDAFHLAVMKRLDIEAIVTNDPDFANAPGVVAIPYGPA
jgi:predicted nucleic acid-binding protein